MDAAIAVMSFRRPNYLAYCLGNLRDQTLVDYVDWHFFQDGSRNPYSGMRRADQETIDRNIEHIENADFPNSHYHFEDEHIGIIRTRDKIFGLLDNYDAILMVEEDCLVSRHGIKIFMEVMEQYPDSVLTLYRNMDIDDYPNYENHLNNLTSSPLYNIFTMGLREHTFRLIEDDWNRYLDIMGEIDHRNRNIEKLEDKLPGPHVYSDDAVMGHFWKERGIPRLAPEISRARYVGREGENYSKESFDEHGHGGEGDIEYEFDRTPTDWAISRTFHERDRPMGQNSG